MSYFKCDVPAKQDVYLQRGVQQKTGRFILRKIDIFSCIYNVYEANKCLSALADHNLQLFISIRVEFKKSTLMVLKLVFVLHLLLY